MKQAVNGNVQNCKRHMQSVRGGPLFSIINRIVCVVLVLVDVAVDTFTCSPLDDNRKLYVQCVI